ncbi:DUF3618 domain-containing protein [Paracoccus indicus]|uniref:DUF3618 domain-containing protein n=1 Tax=Paracoccus indicus TaxID=2079229 RepID=UPI000D3DB1B8|nr:DUF3618 domain-containing protein [Paracoccus indicus]
MTEQTSAEIQREIETERNEMSQTLSELTNRLSPDHLFRQVGDHFRENGGEISRSVGESIKQNPLALALTGVGLSWLIFGQKGSASKTAASSTAFDGSSKIGELPSDASMIQRPSYPAWTQPSRAGDGAAVHETDDQGRLSRAKDSLAAGKDTLSDQMDNARAGIAAGRNKLSDHVDSAKAGATGLISHGKDRFAEMRDSLSQGTEHLSSEARERVITARERALSAQRAASDRARRGTAEVSNYYDQQPLIFGALAMAVGAALAGSLPRSRFEDQHLGEHSDQLIEEAERILRDETEKAKSVYSVVRTEAGDIASEARDAADDRTPGNQSAARSARDYVEKTAERLADTAANEADHQDLGKPT